MVHLTSGDLRNIQDCTRKIHSGIGTGSFPGHIIAAASRLIPSSVVSCAEITTQKKSVVYAPKSSCRTWEGLDAFVRYRDEHPILNFLHDSQLRPHRFREDIERSMEKRFPLLRQYQHYSAAKISDALPDRQFRRLGLFNDFFRRNDVAYQLLLSFLPRGNVYSMISFNRDKRDFSEKERLLLNLIGPHLAQAQLNGEASAQARRAVASLEDPGRSMRSHGLTCREEDVLAWVARGKTNGEVAVILKIAPGTVKVHLERIYQKLGVENRTTAALFMIGERDKSEK